MPFFQELVRQTGSEEAAYSAMEQNGGGKFLAPREVAEAILFLGSDAAAHITGVDLPVDAGYIL
jgi:NAD(P)-dependent dehydrogenase (short-subunit alcohol dehydrogenase family)